MWHGGTRKEMYIMNDRINMLSSLLHFTNFALPKSQSKLNASRTVDTSLLCTLRRKKKSYSYSDFFWSEMLGKLLTFQLTQNFT